MVTGPSVEALAREVAELFRDGAAGDGLAAGDDEGRAREDRQRRERRDERQDADEADQDAVEGAADEPDEQRDADAPRARRSPCVKSTAATMPGRLAIEPTLRSKSPITMTMVMPAATTISIETCWVMLSQLRAVMKVSGSRHQKIRRISAKPISVP